MLERSNFTIPYFCLPARQSAHQFILLPTHSQLMFYMQFTRSLAHSHTSSRSGSRAPFAILPRGPDDALTSAFPRLSCTVGQQCESSLLRFRGFAYTKVDNSRGPHTRSFGMGHILKHTGSSCVAVCVSEPHPPCVVSFTPACFRV